MIKIGNIEVDNPVFLAPMSGVSDMPFRVLVKKLGAGIVVSEMIASEAMVRQTRRTMKMIEKSPIETPCVVQLAGCDPKVMADAAKLNQDMGAQIIDINMGCPVKKVVNGYAGSALMKDEDLASRIMESVVRAVDIPVTLKMRTGWDADNRNAPKLAKIAEGHGIKMLTIHGRTRAQMYNGKADWAFIKTIKDVVSIPVIGNGDVVSVDDAKNLMEIANVDGVMIGRGSYGRPWFLNQVTHYLKTGECLPNPSYKDQYDIIMEHFESILEHYGKESGVKIARKHIGWYSKGIENSTHFRVLVNQIDDADRMREAISEFFKTLTLGE